MTDIDIQDAAIKGNQKGFTLVEVIVVLVIMNIIASVMVPSLTGYIGKAKDKVAIVECRACVQAAQTILTESFAQNPGSLAVDIGATQTLAEVEGTITRVLFNDSAKLEHLCYISGNDITVVYCWEGGCGDCGNSEAFTVDGTLPSGDGLKYTEGRRPDVVFKENIAKIDPAWSAIDSTAGDNGVAKKALLEKMAESGIDLADDNIKSWAVRPKEGGGVKTPVLWWSDQDISQYDVGDQVRVIRYNGFKNTYTAGYMVLVEKVIEKNGEVIETYNIFKGGTQPGDWTEYAGQTDETKSDYTKTLEIFNQMPLVKTEQEP